MNLSKESREFLENLRVFLISSGKNENEIEEIIEELEDHLFEAEKNGKNVENIIGKTPKEYMEQIAQEMRFDFKACSKYIPIVVLGALAYLLLGDALRGGVEFSLLEIIGYPFIFLFSLFLTAKIFKHITSNKISRAKEWMFFGILGFTPLMLFISLFYLNNLLNTPVVQLGKLGNTCAIVFSILVFVGISIWSKTWVSIIIPAILFLPEVLLNKTSLSEITKLIFMGIIVPLCIGVYLFILAKIEKQKS